MSAVTPAMVEEQEKEKKLQEAIKKALDFSDVHKSIERAEEILEKAKRKIKKESSQ